MPKRTAVTNEFEANCLAIFNPSAADSIRAALRQGRLVEKVESLANESGGDYVNFLVDGKVVAHIPGY